MPRYRIFSTYFDHQGHMHRAAESAPLDIDVPAEVGASRKWKPLDAEAQAILSKLGVKAEIILPTAKPQRPAPPAPGAPAVDPGAPDVSEPQAKQPEPATAPKHNKARANDKSPF